MEIHSSFWALNFRAEAALSFVGPSEDGLEEGVREEDGGLGLGKRVEDRGSRQVEDLGCGKQKLLLARSQVMCLWPLVLSPRMWVAPLWGWVGNAMAR